MCLTLHGVENGGEYPVHKIVELIRSVQIPIETHDIAACHYLPGKGKRKSIIVKFLYNHQSDSVWFNRNSFFDPVSGAKIHINERLAESDRNLYNYCRKEKILQPRTKTKYALSSQKTIQLGIQLTVAIKLITLWELMVKLKTNGVWKQ